jgi:hypothetical protein
LTNHLRAFREEVVGFGRECSSAQEEQFRFRVIVIVVEEANFVPKHRKNDIIYFDPSDENNNVTFNPLMVSKGKDKTLVADGVLTAFQKVFGMDESQAPRLLHIFRNCLLSLVEMPNATLMDVQRVLVEPLYRKSVMARVGNPAVRSFWMEEFGKWKTQTIRS